MWILILKPCLIKPLLIQSFSRMHARTRSAKKGKFSSRTLADFGIGERPKKKAKPNTPKKKPNKKNNIFFPKNEKSPKRVKKHPVIKNTPPKDQVQFDKGGNLKRETKEFYKNSFLKNISNFEFPQEKSSILDLFTQLKEALLEQAIGIPEPELWKLFIFVFKRALTLDDLHEWSSKYRPISAKEVNILII